MYKKRDPLHLPHFWFEAGSSPVPFVRHFETAFSLLVPRLRAIPTPSLLPVVPESELFPLRFFFGYRGERD